MAPDKPPKFAEIRLRRTDEKRREEIAQGEGKKDFFHFVWLGGGDLEERKGSQTKKEEGKFSLPPQIEKGKGGRGRGRWSLLLFSLVTQGGKSGEES